MSSCSVAWLLAGDRGTARERGEARRGIARFLGFTSLTLERKRERGREESGGEARNGARRR